MRLLPVVTATLCAPVLLHAQIAVVEISPATASVTAGQRLSFTAVARDSAGRVVTGAPTLWFATPFDVAGIDSTGTLRAFRQGRAQVFAVVGGKPAAAAVEIAPKPPARIALEAPRADVVTGGSLMLTAMPLTDDGEPLRHAPVSFRSVDERVATVDAAGVLTGRAEGTARITASAGAARADITIRVIRNPVTALAISGPSVARTGDVVHLTATATGTGGRAVRDPPVRWSVSGPGGAVYPDGAFVAERAGSYVVTATAGAVAAGHSIRVTPRIHARSVRQVAHLNFSDLQAAELWAVGNVLYVSTIANRVYAFDLSNPAGPVKIDSVLVDAALVNDVSTTPDGRIGVLTREGASTRRNGLVFLDLADPLHPKVLSEYTATVTGGVHSAFIDGHYVYATDDATGSLRVISFANPRAPREVARWEIPAPDMVTASFGGLVLPSGRMLHDVQVKDGLAYLAYWRHGLVILDVGAGIKGGSPERPQLVSQLVFNMADYYPPDYLAGTHAVFRYKNYVFVGDEVFPPVADLGSRERIKSLGRVHVVDVSDLERPRTVAEYNVQDMGSHNIWVEDDVLYMGYYEGGLRVLDVSGELRGDLMAQGREIGAVWTGSSSGYRPNLPMAWGAQPHNGYIYVTDMNSGLWVARLTPAPVP